ncbi:methylesterase 2 [Eucalyptus grandis]|uniref:methylesterase 2 n=1 Tax=Eucalyptus grandis TaxID=71139 RepID=UPI00192EC699|nr:methylesterase 2 [Eucalyptus grandis]
MDNKETQREKHFVLVHGACHGAWCWYRVATHLKSSGHKVTALDMDASRIHPKQAQDLNSMVEYVEPLFEFLEGLPEEEKLLSCLVPSSFSLHSRGFDFGILLGEAISSVPNQAKMMEEVAVTKGKYGIVRRVYIVCDQDLIITEGLQRWMAEMNPPDEVKVISGADHMVMFSKPLELHDALKEIAERYCP